MKCEECKHKKPTTLEEQIDGATPWVCTMKHTECDDQICLMRMQIWLLSDIQEQLWAEEDDEEGFSI